MHSDVLLPIKLTFLQTTQIVYYFSHFEMLRKWANLQLPLNVEKPSISDLKWHWPPDP